ncbi:MAG: putative Ig domain-containing protein [Bdellovibrionota bacterium]
MISGAPGEADRGEYPVTFHVVDALGLEDEYPEIDTTFLSILVGTFPRIAGDPLTSVYEGDSYSFTPTATAGDRPDLRFRIENKPSWAFFNSNTGALTGVPTQEDVGVYENIVIAVYDSISPEAELPPFTITVLNKNDPPAVALEDAPPVYTVKEDEDLVLIPEVFDRDVEDFGDSVTISGNLPAWANVNPATGEVVGRPANADVGTFAGLRLTATDAAGLQGFSHTFTIEVLNTEDAPIVHNCPPAQVNPGQSYFFQPLVTDDDTVHGGTFQVQVANRPHWMNFDPESGALSGTPTADDVGIYPDVHVLALDEGGAIGRCAPVDIAVGNPAPLPQGTPTKLGGPPTLFDRAKFLYDGPNAVQFDVTPGAVKPGTATILRGKVLKESGAPLAGVQVTALGKPEFGYTTTQSDGSYSMAVAGREAFTLVFEKLGYLTAYRRAQAQAQDFTWFDDLALVPEPATATQVAANSPDLQVIEGEAAPGYQPVALMVPGTEAEMALPGGGTQPLPLLSVRMGDLTGSPAGDAAQPATAEQVTHNNVLSLTADEAEAAGALSVSFSKPVAFYAENYQQHPVGAFLPTRSFDPETGEFVHGRAGRVLEILDVLEGAAEIDFTGDGFADDPSELEIDPTELAYLATRYLPGDELTRTAYDHFTYWWNCVNYRVEGHCQDILSAILPVPSTDLARQIDFPVASPSVELVSGVAFEAENQQLLAAKEVTGANTSLVYSSGRAKGRSRSYVVVQLTPDTDTPEGAALWQTISLPTPQTPLYKVAYTLTVAGRVYEALLDPAPGIRVAADWDGKDAYGREAMGVQQAFFQVRYWYNTPINFPYTNNPIRIPVSSQYPLTIGNWNSQGANRLGGWDLSIHHGYDPGTATVHLGDGSMQTYHPEAAGGEEAVVQEVCDQLDCRADPLLAPFHIQTTGLVEIGQHYRHQFGVGERMDGPDNTFFLRRKAWNSKGETYCLDLIHDVDVHSLESGNLVASTNITVIRKGASCQGVVLSNVVDYYCAKNWAGNPDLIREHCGGQVPLGAYNDRVTLDTAGCNNDGALLSRASGGADPPGLQLLEAGQISDIAVAEDGSLYYADSFCDAVVRIGKDGTARRVAGSGIGGFSGDGGPAREARINNPESIALSKDGTLYIADNQNHRIRRVSPSGVITTFIGRGRTNLGRWYEYDYLAPAPNGTPVSEAFLALPWQVRVDEKGRLLLEDERAQYRVSAPYPSLDFTVEDEQGLADARFLVVSQDGSEAWQFDASGRHLKTFDTYTKAELFTFEYDETSGLLDKIVDASGLETTIGRTSYNPATGGGGYAVSLTAPGGQFTELSRDGEELLREIRNPAGEASQYSYKADTDGQGPNDNLGLLETVTSPRSTLAYAAGYAWNGAFGGVSTPTGAHFISPPPAEKPVYEREKKIVKMDGQSRTMRRDQYALTILEGKESPSGKREQHFSYTGRDELQSNSARVGDAVTESYPDGTSVSVEIGRDPRWRGQVPFARSTTTTLPSGLSRSVSVDVLEPSYGPLADPDSDGIIDNPLEIADLKSTVTVNGRKFERSYEASSRELRVKSPEGRVSVTRFDSKGRVIFEQAGTLAPVEYSYDPRGRLLSVTQSGRATNFAWDGRDRLSSVTDPLGRATTISAYDGADRPLSVDLPEGGTLTSSFDPEGNLTGLRAPGQSLDHGFEYSSLNEARKYSPPSLTGASRAGIDWCDPETDSRCPCPAGLTCVGPMDILDPDLETVGPQETEWFYGRDRELVARTTALGGPDGEFVENQYSRKGRLLKTRTDLDEIQRVYDESTGQLIELHKSGVTGAGSHFFEWDGPLPTVERYEAPLDAEVELASYEVQRTFDGNFRLSTETLVAPGLGVNPAVGSVDYASQVATTYDEDSLPLTVTEDTSGAQLVLEWDTNGLLKKKTLGEVEESFSYTSFGELQKQIVRANGQPVLEIEILSRDNLGRILSKLETDRQGLGRLSSYRYDAKGRLSYEKTVAVSSGDFVESEYFYDNAGNRTRLLEKRTRRDYMGNQLPPGRCEWNYEYDAQDRLLKQEQGEGSKCQETYGLLEVLSNRGRAFGWSDSGRMTFETNLTNQLASGYWEVDFPREEYQYGPQGELIQARFPRKRYFGNIDDPDSSQLESYQWDGRGRPIQEIWYNFSIQLGRLVPENKRSYIWSGGNIIGEYAGSVLDTRYVYAPGERVPTYLVLNPGGWKNPALYPPETKVYYLVKDYLGSPRQLIDASTGEVFAEARYTAFGEAKGLGTFRARMFQHQPFGFAGGIYNRGTQTVRFGARDYDPNTGRWTGRDPILFEGNQSNLYAYCNNDPINCVDPKGTVVPLIILGAWAVAEVGLAAWDAYETYDTLTDPNATAFEKWTTGGMFVVGALAPGGGYTAGAKSVFGTSLKAGSKKLAREALKGGAGKAASKFFKGATKKSVDFEIVELSNKTFQFSFISPADTPGYMKKYIQQVDEFGNILAEFKDTLGPNGLIQRKWLHGGP